MQQVEEDLMYLLEDAGPDITISMIEGVMSGLGLRRAVLGLWDPPQSTKNLVAAGAYCWHNLRANLDYPRARAWWVTPDLRLGSISPQQAFRDLKTRPKVVRLIESMPNGVYSL